MTNDRMPCCTGSPDAAPSIEMVSGFGNTSPADLSVDDCNAAAMVGSSVSGILNLCTEGNVGAI
jgi:hypothetical protein